MNQERMHYDSNASKAIMLPKVLWKQAFGLVDPHPLPLITNNIMTNFKSMTAMVL